MEKEQKRHAIVYITDESYVMPTAVSITSFILNNLKKNYYDVYILVNEISDRSRKHLSMLGDPFVRCHLMEAPEQSLRKLSNQYLASEIHVSETAMYKFNVANLLENEDMALYLDCDVIVKQDISELFDIDLTGYFLAAVDDMGDELTDKGKSVQAERIGLHNVQYFNTGMMLLNLKKIREEGISQQLLRYRQEEKNYFMDQDAFNAVMHAKRFSLPIQYNFITAVLGTLSLEEIDSRFYEREHESYEECLKEQKVIHMAGAYKPWKYNMPWITEIFREYYEKSPYGNETIRLSSPLIAANRQIENFSYNYEKVFCKYKFLKKQLEQKLWRFPYEKIEKGCNLILYGAGEVGRDFAWQIKATGYCNLILWVDRDYVKKQGEIKSPDEITGVDFDFILIAVAKPEIAEEIRNDLCRRKIEIRRMII